jgi:hypothetical protein
MRYGEYLSGKPAEDNSYITYIILGVIVVLAVVGYYGVKTGFFERCFNNVFGMKSDKQL